MEILITFYTFIYERMIIMGLNKSNGKDELTFVEKKEIGMDLRVERVKRQLSLRDAGYGIGISENYLSEIERGLKTPSDEVIKGAAELYKLDEKYLFDRYKRIPLVIQDELRENDILASTLYKMVTNDNLTAEKKKEISEAIAELYASLTE